MIIVKSKEESGRNVAPFDYMIPQYQQPQVICPPVGTSHARCRGCQKHPTHRYGVRVGLLPTHLNKIGKFIFQSTNFYGFSHNHPSSNNNLFLLCNIFGSGYPTLKAALNCISVSNPYLLLRNFSQIKQEL